MSLTSQIGSTDVAFKLTQKIVSALAEKFGFKFEDGWDVISSRPVENIQKRLKREKRRSNPASAIKHSRTAFSYYTQRSRPLCQAAHPEATFGQLSRYVSEAWKALTPAQMDEFKAMEAADKIRYQNERAALASATPPAVDGTLATLEEEPVKEKKVKKEKATKATTPTATASASTPAPVTAPAPVSATPKVEKVKSAKASKSPAPAAVVVAPVVVPAVAAPTPVAEAKSAKVKAAKKDVAAVVAEKTKEVVAPVAVKAAPKAKAVKA